MSALPLAELLRHADDTTVTAGPAGLTRRDFAAGVHALAASLQPWAGQRVGLFFQDAASLAAALYACWRAGATAVLPGDVALDILPGLDCAAQGWLSDVPSGPAGLAGWRHYMLAADGGVRSGGRRDAHSGTRASPAASAALDPDAAGIILYTSGSSGRAKPIAKTWRQLELEVAALAAQWPDAGAPPAVLGSVSAMHMYGLPFRVLWPLAAGRPLDPWQHLYPEVLEKATLAYPRAVWVTSPALLRRLAGRLDWQALGGRVQAVYSAGGALPPQAVASLQAESGLTPIEIYGSSETGVVAWRQADAPWRLFPGVHAGLNDEGALWVRSGWAGPGTEQTADAAEFSPDGFRLLGRLDRIVKIEERRIALASVEALLAEHPWVREAHVGKPDDTLRLAALVTLSAQGLHALRNGGRKALVDGLRQHLAGRCHTLAIPRRWRLLAELPWTAQGKLTRTDFLALCGPRPTLAEPQAPPAETADGWRLMLAVPLDLACFSGHFPQAPVVPGVVLVSWAVHWTQRLMMPGLRCGNLENLKFQRLIRPGDVVELLLRWDAGHGKLHFQYLLDGSATASGRLVHAGNPIAEGAAA